MPLKNVFLFVGGWGAYFCALLIPVGFWNPHPFGLVFMGMFSLTVLFFISE